MLYICVSVCHSVCVGLDIIRYLFGVLLYFDLVGWASGGALTLGNSDNCC